MSPNEDGTMTEQEEKAAKIVVEVIDSSDELDKKLDNLMYRSDYQDFIVLLEDDYVATVREKLFEDYHQDETGDVRREIIFRLKTADQFEDDTIDIGEEPDQVV